MASERRQLKCDTPAGGALRADCDASADGPSNINSSSRNSRIVSHTGITARIQHHALHLLQLIATTCRVNNTSILNLPWLHPMSPIVSLKKLSFASAAAGSKRKH